MLPRRSPRNTNAAASSMTSAASQGASAANPATPTPNRAAHPSLVRARVANAPSAHNYGDHRSVTEYGLRTAHLSSLVDNNVISAHEAATLTVNFGAKNGAEAKWPERLLDRSHVSGEGLEMPAPGWEKRLAEKEAKEQLQMKFLEEQGVEVPILRDMKAMRELGWKLVKDAQEKSSDSDEDQDSREADEGERTEEGDVDMEDTRDEEPRASMFGRN